MLHFYTPWKCQKIFGFLTLSEGIEMEYWAKMGYENYIITKISCLISLLNFYYFLWLMQMEFQGNLQSLTS